ncbi:MAG: DUF1570 domain-containing protein [Planctomycetes bacterium]|nr:DUF1570 domain-containing protein [Planctomycetota bacterium]
MRRLTRSPRLASPAWLAVLAAMSIAAPARADALADTLAPHVGKTIDVVELGTGRRFVRPLLVGVVQKDDAVTGLRLRAEGHKAVTTVSRSAIAKIVVDRETVHEGQPAGKAFAQLRGRRARETYDRQVEQSMARMEANGVAPWPNLTAEQHAAEVKSLMAFVAELQQRFPRLDVSETHEFLVASDIPAAQFAPFVADLDAMHDFLCDLYGIPTGEPLWKGKCLVVAFLDEADYAALEEGVLKSGLQGTHGVCHQRSDGRVIMACHRGADPAAFAHMLVHETSHGFNHRWMSPQQLPNWLNEGIAEWVGTRVVRNCDQVPLKEARAVAFMRAQGTLGPGFFTAANIQPVQYGMASGMVRMLISRDARKFAEFVRSIKEGTPVEDALQQTFGGSLDDLVRAYGATVGVPHLAREAE